MTDPTDTEVTSPLVDPSEDAAITALLAGLPQLEMPDDVADRVVAALAAEEPLSGPVPAWAAGGASNVSVLPSQRERERRTAARHSRVLGAAAAVVLVLGAVALGSQVFQGTDGNSDSTAGGAGAAPRSAEQDGAPGTLLTASQANYTKESLDTQVTGLVTAAAAPNAPLTAPGGTPSPAFPGKTFVAEDLVQNGFAVLSTCVHKLAVQPGEIPIAVDAGTWSGAAAVVIVLPGGQPSRVAVFVVSPACGDPADPDAHVLYYAAVPRP